MCLPPPGRAVDHDHDSAHRRPPPGRPGSRIRVRPCGGSTDHLRRCRTRCGGPIRPMPGKRIHRRRIPPADRQVGGRRHHLASHPSRRQRHRRCDPKAHAPMGDRYLPQRRRRYVADGLCPRWHQRRLQHSLLRRRARRQRGGGHLLGPAGVTTGRSSRRLFDCHHPVAHGTSRGQCSREPQAAHADRCDPRRGSGDDQRRQPVE